MSIAEQIEYAERLAGALKEMVTTPCESEVGEFLASQKAVRSVNNEIEKLKIKKSEALARSNTARSALAEMVKRWRRDKRVKKRDMKKNKEWKK